MSEIVIAQEALDRLRRIHALSARMNSPAGVAHEERILSFIRKHVDEIEPLLKHDRAHALVETGDLVVLCLELLLENGADIDAVLRKCFVRFERKLEDPAG